jgi:ribonuclease R
MSQLGPERFHFDEAAQTIEGLSSGRVFKLGDRLDVRIADANPISGGLRFELVDAGPAARPLRAPRPRAGKPRRPPLPRGARNNRRKR